jgi:hypothetical protein
MFPFQGGCSTSMGTGKGTTINHPNGLSLNGLENGVSLPLLPLPLGGGFGGVAVIITSDIELSSTILNTSGLEYGLLCNILFLVIFKCKRK